MACIRIPKGTAPDGSAVETITLVRTGGISVSFLTYGATMTSLKVNDRDVVLGYDRPEDYFADTASIGVTVGRYANRIADGEFALNGVTYDIGRNETARHGHLHGGEYGFQKKNWRVECCEENAFVLSHLSSDGDMGYPGTLTLRLRVELTDDNAVALTYTAVSDKDTVVNFTNHAYFNLNGYNGDNVLDTVLQIDADAITPVNERLIPTGEYLSVEGTPFDFRNAKPIGQDITACHEQLQIGGGYDHNFVLNNNGTYRLVATAHAPQSGITMECFTDQPGLQLYTANFLNTDVGKGGAMIPHQGFCLETQHFPDSPHHPHFPSTVLRAGETLVTRTAYRFI